MTLPDGVNSATCDGSTHASAVRLTERATPTTVSVGLPGRSGNSSFWPSRPSGPVSADRTISPELLTQRPLVIVNLSIPPPGVERPATESGAPLYPSNPGVTVAVGNGPDVAATPNGHEESAS